jgi:hypothetical protein
MIMNLDEFNFVAGSTAEDFTATALDGEHRFPWQILKMNQMYELPINPVPTLDRLGESPVLRMQGFLRTLQKEINEGLQILAYLIFREWKQKGSAVADQNLADLVQKVGIQDPKLAEETLNALKTLNAEGAAIDQFVLVSIADWLGDMVVYQRSEALKYGIPLESVLALIMGSNFTKLGENGEVLKDENGKFLKGPNFVAPENHIAALLFGSEELIEEFNERQAELDNIKAVTVPVLIDPMAQVFEAEADLQADADDQDSDEDVETEEGSNGVFYEG